MSTCVRGLLLVGVTAVLAGCGGGHDRGAMQPPGGGRGGLVENPSGSQLALLRRYYPGWNTDFTKHAVPLSQFVDGGPPRDGIPPIDHPRPVSLRAGDRFLGPREPVIAVVVNGQARGYPEQILVWHEIVNDTLGGMPIAVTYCPLCNSAIAFDRRVGGRVLTFGTTGKLRNSDLVMWDRQTQSWWQQFSAVALVGRYTGTRLRPIDTQVMSWSDFEIAYPHATVLSRRTGFDRPYGSNPYIGYDQPKSTPFLYDGKLDPRLPPKERVVAIFAPKQTVVVPFSALQRRPVIAGDAAGTPFVVLFAHGTTTVLDQPEVSSSRDVGAAAVFVPRTAGRDLTFTPARDGFRDVQSGSLWNLAGQATAGPLRGRRLRPLRHDEQFWFALAAFVPHARLLAPGR
jgi:hypothetical protein